MMRTLIVLGAVLALASCAGVSEIASPADDPAAGPVSGYDDTLTSIDAKDGRAIPMRVLTSNSCGDACPLLIFSHGANATYDRYDQLLLPLADMGYRIVAPNHVDSEEHPNREAYGRQDAMGHRIEDYEALAAHFDAETHIAIGHSFGGLIAQIAGGATLLSDPALGVGPAYRPIGVIAISPPGPVPGLVDAAGWSKIEPPMMVVTGTTDIVPMMADEWEAHLVSYEAATHPDTYSLIYTDMDHYMNGAYGREKDLEGEALTTRNAAMAHLVQTIDAFAQSVINQSLPDAEAWNALSDSSVDAMNKKEMEQ